MTIGTNYGQYPYYTDQVQTTNVQPYIDSVPRQTGLVSNTQSDTYIINNGSSACTDGKDDGKIGFFSAIGNAIKGVGKTVVNGVKGMFTNKEGKFSLGKTLLTAAIASVCIAFPAVGVAACAVGGVMGAVQIGKGIGRAASATTDAEAKAAWQDIGGGAFTVAASVVGAKAGMKAVGKTSTAGLANLDDAAAVAAKANGKTSALSQLDDAATFGQKARAYGQDMISSTKNQGANIYKNIKNTYNSRVEYKKAKVDLDDARANFDEAKKNGWTEETYQAADDVKFAQDKLIAAEKNYKYAGVEEKVVNVAKHPVKSVKNNVSSNFSKLKGLDKQSISNIANKLTSSAQKAWSEISTGKYSYAEAVSKYGYENVAEIVKVAGGTIFAEDQIL